jgi:electron transfer flavoprotein alpha subunit
MPVLIIAEHDNAHIKSATLPAVTAARACGGEVHLLVAGANAGGAAQEAATLEGVSKVLLADGPHLEHQLAENLAMQIVSIARDYSHVVLPATASGKNVAPP